MKGTKDEMTEFMLKYWLQTIFGLAVAILSKCYHQITTEIKQREKESEAIREGVLAMLHDRLFQAGRYYLAKGEITFAELDNFDRLYNAYHALGGNGTGTEIYERIHEMNLQGGQ